MPITINGSTGIAGVDGSASTPAIQGTDTNTGVTFPAADTVAIATGGSERMRVDSSGNLGVGTNSPTKKLDVFSSGATTVDFAVRNSTVALSSFVDSGAGYVGTSTNHPAIFLTNNTERARITSGGDLLIARTTKHSSERVSISGGTGECLIVQNDAGTRFPLAFVNGSTTVGSISTTGSATAYNTSSDYRLKENVKPMQNALAKVALLNPVTYTWKADGSDGQGFIAHELQAVVPDAVTGEKDAVDVDGNPVYQGVDTSFLVATLTKAIQELNAKVEGLQAEINALKGAA